MNAILAFLMLGSATIVLAQNGTSSCNCDGLRTCLSSTKPEKEASFEQCHSDCLSKSNIPTAAKTCFTSKQSAMESLKEQRVGCFFNSTNGVCSGTRNRRQVTDGINQENGQTNRTGGKTTNRIGGKHGHRGSHGGPGLKGIEELKPYYECVHNCIEQIKSQQSNGTSQGREQQRGRGRGGIGGKRHGGGFMPGMKECAESSKCNLTRDDFRNASKSCNDRDQHMQVEQKFCICLREALNKNETTLYCPTPSANEGRRSGFQHEGRHGWGGNGGDFW